MEFGTGVVKITPAHDFNDFATGKRPSRVLGGLCNQVPLPAGVSSINLPIIGQGSTVLPIAENAGVPSSDITDTAGSSTV